MEEFKGTGGKWILKQQGDANEYCIVTDDMKWVSAFKLNGEQRVETQLANMNLFTAAPELLKALQELHDLLEENEPNWYLVRHHNRAEKSINKALGINGNETEEA